MPSSTESGVDEILIKLLRAYSPTGREENARNVIVEICEDLGLRVEIDEVGNVLASKGVGGRVWLVGHYDTVPGRIPVRRRGGVISGRGAVDAKGPLSAMLMAASLSKSPVTVAALVGEEGDSRGARHLLTRELPPFAVIGEPSNKTGVIIAYRGGAHLTLRCKAEGGHSSSPGVSAVDLLIESILKMRELAPSREYDDPSIAVTMIRGGEASNVLPKKAEAVLDLRVPPRADLDSTIDDMASKVSSDCELDVGWTVPPVSVKPSDPVPRALTRSIISLGGKPKL
ncbi:MAG: M20/M25/M40 family metallo-hydrolase, partial [Candidatus Korarchaeota archaeon]|nr:M20/M25/M40 family metallo-hydrolase [Candidatus Korarchaeota archaeon]